MTFFKKQIKSYIFKCHLIFSSLFQQMNSFIYSSFLSITWAIIFKNYLADIVQMKSLFFSFSVTFNLSQRDTQLNVFILAKQTKYQ